ncbi:hypothetical protein QU24_04390 [Pantoea rodasii]|uniref:Leucine-binding protein domain-containing protein n=1 Tax=Pantoea rodasii TaxID=1076549 RepID=A0A0B1RDW8_9GAMM|nr:ABC transporter substrate-binding protein [Pantoea rodasii]KHJ69285.1 hypothetical protein QU24_04390 [Pantoea rodasii]
MKVGLAIALGSDSNHHSRTFIRAVNYSLDKFSCFRNVSLKIVNDKKNSEGGVIAAKELLQWGAQVVVGHFSSIAAISAIPVYIDADIPLLLPASTSSLIDEFNPISNNIFRYQKTNESLISYCVDACKTQHAEGRTYFLIQDNEYGNMMMMHIPSLSDVCVIRSLPGRINKRDTFVVIGYSNFAAKIINQLTEFQIEKLILIDDADNPDVWKECLLSPASKSRIRTTTHICRHNSSEPFFNETLLALSLATHFCMNGDDQSAKEKNFNTYLGIQEFDQFNFYGDSYLIEEKIK